jgi:hypothetical protein
LTRDLIWERGNLKETRLSSMSGLDEILYEEA